MGKADNKSLIRPGKIENLILLVRGEKVILDADLARLYGVPTMSPVTSKPASRGHFSSPSATMSERVGQ